MGLRSTENDVLAGYLGRGQLGEHFRPLPRAAVVLSMDLLDFVTHFFFVGRAIG